MGPRGDPTLRKWVLLTVVVAFTCEKLPMLRVVAMPVHVVGAGKVPEAALRFLLAAVHAIEFVAQPGQVRVLAWMSNAVRGPGCARGGAQAAVARPTGACRTLGREGGVRAPRARAHPRGHPALLGDACHRAACGLVAR